MFEQAFIKEVVENLLETQPKEIKGKGKMTVWLLRHNMKHKDLEDYLSSDIVYHDAVNDAGEKIKEHCAFIAVDKRDNSLLFATLLTPKFGKKFHAELKRNRVKHNHAVNA